MDQNNRFKFFIVLGTAIIASTIFLTFKYLFKGPPFVKVGSLLIILGVTYVVVDFLIKQRKKLDNE